MSNYKEISLLLLRVSLGWLFFWAGITKVINPAWSAAGYLRNAKMWAPLYQWFASPELLPIVNFLNEWGLTLLGVSLILGAFVRISAWGGVLLMLLYYFAQGFPRPNANSFVVDEHIVYALALIALAAWRAGEVWGIDGWPARADRNKQGK